MTIDSFMNVPLIFLLVYAGLNVYMGIKGRLHPWQVMVRAFGGAVYIFGYGLMVKDAMDITGTSANIMLWGFTVSITPRLHYLLHQIRSDSEADKEFEERYAERRAEENAALRKGNRRPR